MSAAQIAERLNGPQRKALLGLPREPGHYLVNALRDLSPRSYRGLRELGVLDEQWTWASTTRPDVGLSALGRDVVAQLSEQVS